MTTAAKNMRWQAVKLADALNAIEGVPVSRMSKRCPIAGQMRRLLASR